MSIAKALGIVVIAEGVETAREYKALPKIGIRYMQGYLLARPGFKSLPVPLPLSETFLVEAFRDDCEIEMSRLPPVLAARDPGHVHMPVLPLTA